MTLDTFVDPHRAPRSGPVQSMLNSLIKELGPDWVWDDTHAEGLRIRNPQITLKLEDLGSGLLGVEAVMPDRFTPAPGFTRLFSVGARAIAAQIINQTLFDYLHVIEHTGAHEDDEERWEHSTRDLLTQIGAQLGMPTKIEVGHDPGLHLTVLFQRAVGDSLRIHASPGVGPNAFIYVPGELDLWPITQAWKRLGELPETPEEKLSRAIHRVADALDGNDKYSNAFYQLLHTTGLWWRCAADDCTATNGPDDAECAECKTPRPTA